MREQGRKSRAVVDHGGTNFELGVDEYLDKKIQMVRVEGNLVFFRYREQEIPLRIQHWTSASGRK